MEFASFTLPVVREPRHGVRTQKNALKLHAPRGREPCGWPHPPGRTRSLSEKHRFKLRASTGRACGSSPGSLHPTMPKCAGVFDGAVAGKVEAGSWNSPASNATSHRGPQQYTAPCSVEQESTPTTSRKALPDRDASRWSNGGVSMHGSGRVLQNASAIHGGHSCLRWRDRSRRIVRRPGVFRAGPQSIDDRDLRMITRDAVATPQDPARDLCDDCAIDHSAVRTYLTTVGSNVDTIRHFESQGFDDGRMHHGHRGLALGTRSSSLVAFPLSLLPSPLCRRHGHVCLLSPAGSPQPMHGTSPGDAAAARRPGRRCVGVEWRYALRSCATSNMASFTRVACGGPFKTTIHSLTRSIDMRRSAPPISHEVSSGAPPARGRPRPSIPSRAYAYAYLYI